MPWVIITNGGTLGLAISQLKYKYYYTDNNNIKQQYDPVAGPPTTGVKSIINQLASVKDDITTTGGDDIKNQADKNYAYDAIGNLTKDTKEGITNITWNVYGKIQSITKTNPDLTTTNIGYTYDASGNRISKTVNGLSTYYVRDASGNTMAIYESNNSAVPQLKESHLYGSSRLGMATQLLVQPVTVSIAPGFGTGILSTFTRGEKIFELSNHLQNVLVTVSDKKIPVSANGTTIDYYNADVVTAADYYPFGMQMPGRKYTQANSNYRYGFNGKENDNEVKGEGNQQDYGMRIYDPRLGKFLSVDPLTPEYQMLTPYQFASNRPIDGIDQDGLEWKPVTGANGNVTDYTWSGFNADGSPVAGTKQGGTVSNNGTTYNYSSISVGDFHVGFFSINDGSNISGRSMISGNSASFGFDEVDENGRSTNTAFYSGHLGNAQGASGDQLASSLNSKFKDYEFATKPQLPNGSIGGGFMPGEDLVGGTFKAGGMLLLKKVGANFIFKKSLAAFGMAVIKRPLISASTKVEQTVSHHIFNVFRGKSPGSQKYRDFFLKHKIKVDDHTVKIPNSLHTFIHGKGKDWTNKWRKWIDDHPNATTKDVYQQAGKMMDKAGIGHLPIMPHRKK